MRDEIFGPDYHHSRSAAGHYLTPAVFWVFRLDRNIGRKADDMANEALAALRQACLVIHITLYDIRPRRRPDKIHL